MLIVGCTSYCPGESCVGHLRGGARRSGLGGGRRPPWVPRSRTCCVGTCRWAIPSPTSAWRNPLGSVPTCRSTQLRRTGPWVDCPPAAPAPAAGGQRTPGVPDVFGPRRTRRTHPRRSGSTVNATFGGSATVSAQVNPLDVFEGPTFPRYCMCYQRRPRRRRVRPAGPSGRRCQHSGGNEHPPAARWAHLGGVGRGTPTLGAVFPTSRSGLDL